MEWTSRIRRTPPTAHLIRAGSLGHSGGGGPPKLVAESSNYSELPFPEAVLDFEFEVLSDRRGRRRLLVAFLVLVFAFARRLVFFADRFFRVDAPGAPIRKSSRFAPSSIFSAIHLGIAPRPAQVFCALSGSRYLAAILPPKRLRVKDELEPPPSR
jgi:hypothetical protein